VGYIAVAHGARKQWSRQRRPPEPWPDNPAATRSGLLAVRRDPDWGPETKERRAYFETALAAVD
jgi:hypothetical protein